MGDSIIVSSKTKEVLEKLKGNMNWDDFLLLLANVFSLVQIMISLSKNGESAELKEALDELQKIRENLLSKEVEIELKRLREILGEEGLRAIEESYKERHKSRE